MANSVDGNIPTRWILLRGLGRDSRHWGKTVSVLEKEVPYHQFFALDLPGTGIERDLSAPLSIADNVDFLRQKYASLLREGPVNLLAISLGGMVAADWMSRFPDEIAGGVFINTSSQLSPFYQRLYPPAALGLIGALVKAKLKGSALALEQSVAGWVVNNSGQQQTAAIQWASFYTSKRLGVATLCRQLIAAAQFSPPRLTQPLLLVNSQQDRLVNPCCTERLAQYWHQAVVSHPIAGHDLPVDDPQWLAQTIGQWLLQQRTGAH
ncbi:alpha/beta hydrolase [Maricurvus nonylphenolicus]|uniref:alpha/beta fold hydrolase n=1 Tax=Maricurvus nonylphenolicus TaxID=1008307 RepID=UPI0036F232AC